MNTFGRIFKVTIYGSSHGLSLGVIIDGMPEGFKFNLDELKKEIKLRNPNIVGTTPRKEEDEPLIRSGIYNDYTTGDPINIEFINKNRINSYDFVLDTPRPGHGDFVRRVKFKGYNEYMGGGSTSGRMTLCLVVAGFFAKNYLKYKFDTNLIQVGTFTDISNKEKLEEYLNSIKEDSVGGIIESKISNIEIGLGEPFFDSVESVLSHLIFSIPGVKGIEFGIGFKGINLLGSSFNDVFITKEGKTKTNNNGGINSGITNGNELVVRVFLKPTSSILKPQTTYNFKTNKLEEIRIPGRHDKCFALRSNIIIENTIAIGLMDLYLLNKLHK